METSVITKKKFLLIVIFSLMTFCGYFFAIYQDKTTKLIFCNVGQGDAAYIRVKNRIDVLIDAGPDRKILNCVGKYMPFWDKKIELAIISHPQKDHFGGFLYLLDRYQIEKILMPPLDNPNQSFTQLKQKIRQKKISINFPVAGKKISLIKNSFYFYWPTEKFLSENLFYHKFSSFESGRRIDKQILGASSLDDNNFSLVFLFQEGKFKVLFTGDITPAVLNSLNDYSLANLTVLKIPHHGSKNGLTEKFLRLANPAQVVISVGKNNSYGHPAKEILDLLEAYKIKIRRTDVEGDIIFKIKDQKSKIKSKKL